MGSMFRSEEMALSQLFIQPEAAYQSISELGETGTVQFRDLNEDVSAFQRKFVGEVRRCDEMERKLRYIEAEVRKDDVPIPDVLELPKAPNPREIIDLEAHIEKTEGDIRELSESAVKLKSNYLELAEFKHVLEKTQSFFIEQEEANGMDTAHKSLIPEDNQGVTARGRLGFVAGVVNRERVPAFERMLWRISRGNVFLRQAEIEKALEDPTTGNEIIKTVFVAFFQGEQLKSRITKVCAGFHASIYQCSSSSSERNEMLQNVKTRIEDLNLVLNQTADHRSRVLVTVAKELQNWSIMVRKMKAIYHTLNMFNMDVTKKCLIGECWVPTKDIPVVQKALQDGSSAGGSSITSFLNVIETNEQPPTFNRTNKFTKGFQNLIDSYGVASYREVNPALYTIITFPFLFAIMFGDVGHGFILFLFGLWMVVSEKKFAGKKGSEIFNIFFAGRYIILLMGIFSVYTGFIYNDIFSRTMNIFGSSWRVNLDQQTTLDLEEVQLNPTTDFVESPYFMGVDPAWMLAKNKIIFLNSYKMKLSIIFGVFHMMFGVCMSVVNFRHFRKMENFFFMFLPQIIFLMLLFLWMVVMMFVKWIMYSSDYDAVEQYKSHCAPSVLILFINMMLFSGNEVPQGCKEYMFDGQSTLQMVFVVVAVICIPVMLLGNPFYVMFKRRTRGKHVREYEIMNGDVNQGIELQGETTLEEAKPAPSGAHHGGGHDEHDEGMGDLFIHQAIHTIEYVLSTVSHTASYLRLWALSLAHAQLSEVLWNMVLQKGLVIGYLMAEVLGEVPGAVVGGIIIYFIFYAWSCLTIAILVMMEGLSAFLHTLRLHWVEFMSKFYEGLGHEFLPFSFQKMLDGEDQPED